MTKLESLGDGLWRWALPHPEWHPSTDFGAEVACWAIHDGGRTIVVDPLVPEDDGDLAEQLDGIVEGEVAIFVTIPYHVRSAEPLAERWSATVYGHPDVARRFGSDDVSFEGVESGKPFAGGLTAYRIGSPPRKELPLYVAGRRALAFGDAIVGVEDELRVWLFKPANEKREQWYRERLVPTFEPLLELDVDQVLTTHGPPVLDAGGAALRGALAAPPWYHRPS